MQYLTQRGSVYWFNRRAPKPLRPGAHLSLDDVETKVLANGYVRFSLQTAEPKEASRLARKFAHLLDNAVEQRKNRKPPRTYASADGAPTQSEIERAADCMYAQLLAADDESAVVAMASILQPDAATDDCIREPDRYRNNTFARPSQYWMPLLGLYTGARIAELASLELKDIQVLEGCPSYYLSHPDGANAGGKNAYAPRWVPVHPELLSAGFMQYVGQLRAGGHTRLFPCLGKAARDGYGKRATDDFVKYRRKCGVGANEGEGRSEQTFHSFRSTLVSRMVECRIDGDTRRMLVGHVSSDTRNASQRDVHSTIYDQSEVQINQLSEALAQVEFGLRHPAFSLTPAMSIALARKRRGA